MVLNSSTSLSALTDSEKLERDECEAIICSGWDTFLDVGRALMTVRNKRLYRDQHGTFEDYCRRKWAFSKSHANRLIEAALVASILTPIGAKPANESQLRPLVGLPPQKISDAWKKAQQLAGNGEVTAKVVREAAREFKIMSKPERKRRNPQKSNSKQAAVQIALDLVDQIEKDAQEGNTKTVLKHLQKLKKELRTLC